jgi:threonine/homoserine/homoserine lactone efflux protein
MKKETKKSILFYAASALLYMASLISFISGNDNSMAVVWLCLGSSFLCLGSIWMSSVGTVSAVHGHGYFINKIKTSHGRGFY